jgi:DNA-directed RNA polymerase, mitochondrial
MTVQYEGGYFIIPEQLVRGYGPNAHTANDLSKLSNYAVESVNHIQSTPWMVNPFVHDVISAMIEAGEDIIIQTRSGPETILMIQPPLDPRHNPFEPVMQQIPEERWAAMTSDEKKAFKAKRFRVLQKYDEDFGIYRATLRIFKAAEEMRQFEKFYFPHNMDFRTRIYPIPTDLTPQSNDLSKGLLRFARPTPLGKEGMYWMGFTVASQWGEDKLSPNERYMFASDPEFLTKCALWVDDPLVHRGWLEADSPFQFLAVAHEWVWANRSKCPEGFLSYMAGNLDGSCNGAQHLSIMARDLVGAEATNCRSQPSRKDLYMEVGNRAWQVVERDAAKGNPIAIEWVPKMMDPSSRRGLVKRSVMTVPYGVTEFGVADFMIKDKHVDDSMENKWNAAKYMRDIIMSSIDETLANGRRLQRWFQACAVKCAENGLPLQWDTPAGSKITQAYRNVIQRRIQSFQSKFYIYEEPQAGEDQEEFLARIGMDEKKMGTAAPPNVVHSCDASHLQITVCRMADAGIKDFSMIHDSFGCPMAHVGLMRDILRQSAVDMYAGDYLQTWKESVERYSGLTMPEPPELGDFDITEILESEFFFS